MSPRTPTLLLILALVAGSVAPTALAQDCRIGTGPAATLLIPYFEVDLEAGSNGVSTLFSVVNEHSAGSLVRITLWTDWGLPTLGFDLYLRPLEVQTINVRDLFRGYLPLSGGKAGVSGLIRCDVVPPPVGPNPVLGTTDRQQLRADHTGVDGPREGGCVGENHGDGLARGYITVDNVGACQGLSLDPAASARTYNNDVLAPLSSGNSLWGNYLTVDPANAYAQGSEAVAVWADPTGLAFSSPTFYRRISDGQDRRVPLPSRWVSRFLNGGPFTGGTELIVWRDTGSFPLSGSTRIHCGGHPSWWPLGQQAVARDESASLVTTPGVSTPLAPLATQKIAVSDLGIPFAFGRLWLDLANGTRHQAWVQTVMSARGQYSLGLNARSLNELCERAP